MIFIIAIAALVIVGVVLYAHHKHLSAIAEVKGIAETVRSLVRAQCRVPPAASASPAAPKVEQP